MLFIKFNILDSSKFSDFKKLFAHMVAVRQPGFKFEEQELPIFDWDNMTDKEMADAFVAMDEFDDKDKQEASRYKMLVPDYANMFLESYINVDNNNLGALGIKDVVTILNYLEHDFEVEMNNLETLNKSLGIVEFSTGNFPFGGIERFLMTLKAFDLIPFECFDGFSIVTFNWTSDFEYDAINLPEKTKTYLKNRIC